MRFLWTLKIIIWILYCIRTAAYYAWIAATQLECQFIENYDVKAMNIN